MQHASEMSESQTTTKEGGKSAGTTSQVTSLMSSNTYEPYYAALCKEYILD
jgi:hypothetical protein